jgi:hypothetical protein
VADAAAQGGGEEGAGGSRVSGPFAVSVARAPSERRRSGLARSLAGRGGKHLAPASPRAPRERRSSEQGRRRRSTSGSWRRKPRGAPKRSRGHCRSFDTPRNAPTQAQQRARGSAQEFSFSARRSPLAPPSQSLQRTPSSRQESFVYEEAKGLIAAATHY